MSRSSPQPSPTEPDPRSGAAVTPIARTKLARSVADRILADIRAQGLTVGARMPSERELMSSLGVGRSTIREAINGLAMLGVLEIRHGQGAFVSDGDAGQVLPSAIGAALGRGFTRDLFEAREVVETSTARLAALRRTDADLREIAQALADHERAIAEARPAVEPSVRFHFAVAEAAHSEVLASFVSSFGQLLTERGLIIETMDGFREWEVGQHRMVLEPIRDREPELAAERMAAHLTAVVHYHERLGVS